MNKIFAYLAFGMELAEVIPSVISLAKSGPLSAPAVLSVISPVVTGLQSTFGVTVPPQLLNDAVAAVVDVVNAFEKKA